MHIFLRGRVGDLDPSLVAQGIVLTADRFGPVQCIVDLLGRRLDLQGKGVFVEARRLGKNDPVIADLVIFIFLPRRMKSQLPRKQKDGQYRNGKKQRRHKPAPLDSDDFQ